MKKLTQAAFKTFVLSVMAVFYQMIAFAQDSTVKTSEHTTTTTATETHEWYTQPWMWVVGIAVFIIILVALVRGNSSASTPDRVTVTKTVKRDSESE